MFNSTSYINSSKEALLVFLGIGPGHISGYSGVSGTYNGIWIHTYHDVPDYVFESANIVNGSVFIDTDRGQCDIFIRVDNIGWPSLAKKYCISYEDFRQLIDNLDSMDEFVSKKKEEMNHMDETCELTDLVNSGDIIMDTKPDVHVLDNLSEGFINLFSELLPVQYSIVK